MNLIIFFQKAKPSVNPDLFSSNKYSKSEFVFPKKPQSNVWGTILILYAVIIPFTQIHPGLAIFPVAILGIIGESRFPWKTHYWSIPERIGDVISTLVVLGLSLLQEIIPNPFAFEFNKIIQSFIAVAIMDFVGYLIHYLAHRISFCWYFHKVHHSRTNPSFWNTSYEHFIDALFRLLGPGMILVFLGFHPDAVATATCFSALFGTISHLNIRVSFPKIISLIFVTPQTHRIHHDKHQVDTNCGVVTHLWDHINGTYKYYEMDETDFGLIEEQQISQSPINIFWIIKK